MRDTSKDRLKALDGAPAWVTPEIIALTIETFEPYYDEAITEEEALGIVLNISRLAEGWRWS
jgi:hypothetical protein